ncbi:uncharacterized protein LOC111101475 isoform X3 [Crassostrea virginica]
MIRCDVVLLVLILDINSSVFSRKYLHCKTGQHGLNCQHKCTYPYYGKRCIYKCNCPNQYCHYERGCLLPAKGCNVGYTGPFCESQCSYPKFGYGCQMLCYCPKQRCNFSSGCQMEKNNKMKQNNNRYVQDPSNNHEWVKISLVVFGVALFVTIIMNIVISFARSCSIEQVQR